MILALLIVGIFAVLAGLLAILFGYSVREFSVGSTLIISGTIGVCTGMLLVGLHLLLLELRRIARRLAAGSAASSEVRVRPVLPGLAMPGAPAPEPALASPAKTEPEPPPAAGPPPWQSEAALRERPGAEAPEPPTPPAAPEAPRRRNLLFASTSRKERERAEAKPTEGRQPSHEEPAAPDGPPASFEDAWPKPERMRPPEPPVTARRPPPRSPSIFAEAAPPPPAPEPAPSPEPAAAAEQTPVTVLKSGVVDGMSYSLYSDGSIEAQMPEGMMRFASIDELRAHLDQRG
ncbi:DUF308 domain-containing protein [Bradyrhizobium sp. 147]|uniref:DUF308 domain-containing protein n=1 Tax=Bradyrhizobium sp. 147 TaxID=2782623 RepID=UPI001FF7665F|nr:DUF308 domain-containing protein [Bradyrhizobium sp. 147]MCK1679692.1 DUF308 domain-containing protein [Bradyrhizobium sp. 147]